MSYSDRDMLSWLHNLSIKIPEFLERPFDWETLVINKRKPHTYRAWTMFGNPHYNIRVCLHRFEPCTQAEAFFHPHPWPGAFSVLEGRYKMKIGYSEDRQAEPKQLMTMTLGAGSTYAMTDPMLWHSVQPLTTCYSIMVNADPWPEVEHERAPTTKGKDLDRMSREELEKHLSKFKELLSV